MALVIKTLEDGILAALEKQANKSGQNDDPEQSRKELAEDLAIIIDSYIKSATVNVVGVQTGGGTAIGTIS